MPTRAAQLLRDNWLAIALALAGVASSYYFYLRGQEVRQPVFVVDPVRAYIFDSEAASDGLRVIAPQSDDLKDTAVIEGDVTALRFYFWNAGNRPIRKEDILRRLRLSLGDDQAQVLSVRLLKVSRADIVDARLFSEEDRSVAVDFRILEQGDGFSGQIIFAGDPAAQLSVDGVIEGVHGIDDAYAMRTDLLVQKVGVFLGVVAFFAVVALVIMLWSRFVSPVGRRLLGPARWDRLGQVIGMGTAAVVLLGMVLLVVRALIKPPANEMQKFASSAVPASIRPSTD